MKNERKNSNKKIFEDIMNKIKLVSDVLDYDELNIQYFNSFSPLKGEKEKKERQKKINNKNKTTLEKELEKISKDEPLFKKVEIAYVNNHPIILDKISYLANIKYLRFYDLNDKQPIKTSEFEIISKEPIKTKNIPKPYLYKVEVIQAVKNENDEIKHEMIIDNENSSTAKEYKAGGIGAILGGIAGVAIGIGCLSGGAIIAAGAAGAAVVAGLSALISKIFK